MAGGIFWSHIGLVLVCIAQDLFLLNSDGCTFVWIDLWPMMFCAHILNGNGPFAEMLWGNQPACSVLVAGYTSPLITMFGVFHHFVHRKDTILVVLNRIVFAPPYSSLCP